MKNELQFIMVDLKLLFFDNFRKFATYTFYSNHDFNFELDLDQLEFSKMKTSFFLNSQISILLIKISNFLFLLKYFSYCILDNFEIHQ